MASNVWECECGHFEYGKYPPEECSKCWAANSFNGVPEDRTEELDIRIIKNLKKKSVKKIKTKKKHAEEDDDED